MSDKKRSKEFGGTEAFNRIKKEMVKEMKGLGAEEQVLLIGCSAAPQMCVKKDEKAFMGFFDKHIYLPLPDYASRLVSAASSYHTSLHVCATSSSTLLLRTLSSALTWFGPNTGYTHSMCVCVCVCV